MGIKNNTFKSESEEYETPKEIFEPLQKEFNLQLDVCASSSNHKLNNYFTKENDALTKDWHKQGNFWMNPPFGRQLKKWVQKAYEESCKGVIGVSILPVRSNTNWWHEFIIDVGAEVRFLKGEIKFGDCKRGLWLPFAIVIWKSGCLKTKSLRDFPTENIICVKEDLLRKSPNSINRTSLNANIMPNFKIALKDWSNSK